MWMWKGTVCTVAMLWLAQAAHAWPLQIAGTWRADSETSCSVTLAIENQGSDGVLLSSLQLVCQILPAVGVSTNAFFTDLHIPTGNFVFGSQYLADSGIDPVLGTELWVAAFSTDGGANVQPPDSDVPQSTDVLQFSLISPSAAGTFDIALVSYTGPESGSYWTDGDGAYQPFFDPDCSSGVVTTIAFPVIPEPPSGLLLLSGVAALILIWVVRGKPLHCEGSSCC